MDVSSWNGFTPMMNRVEYWVLTWVLRFDRWQLVPGITNSQSGTCQFAGITHRASESELKGDWNPMPQSLKLDNVTMAFEGDTTQKTIRISES
jgi:hypothetical protein